MHWIFLILAVVGEVLGTTLMKLVVEEGYLLYGTLIALVMVGFSYLLLSRATLHIPITLANAFWEGVGMVLIALASLLWLGEQISGLQAAGLVLALVGVALTNYGHYYQEQQESAS
ncbi:MAG: multidrug efflux SMR transporter [Oceanospirillales bacterium]|uniref:Spermidine export protein MdtJ n=1 Tax=Marinobacterium halophilum TaxID=267374 RepID=A0A2P8ERL2_9GAMM|nr:SMR family transporter [Marinobacterium halophilum]MBR9828489.1 multidrug efflux SMR transporter [Oceanospirillales bacterium]PSL12075.1 spermidine export protein MdtJ [Marinobacterium halophilum]